MSFESAKFRIRSMTLSSLEVAFYIRRRSDEDEGVGFFDNIVDVGGELDAACVEMQSCEIGRVVAQALEFFDSIIPSNVPVDAFFMVEHNLGNSRCPATTSHDCYSSTTFKLHSVIIFLRRRKKRAVAALSLSLEGAGEGLNFGNDRVKLIHRRLLNVELVFLQNVADLLLDFLCGCLFSLA